MKPIFLTIFLFLILSCSVYNFDEQMYRDFFYGSNESFYESAKPFYIEFGFPNIIEEQYGDYHFVYYWYTKIQYKVSFLEESPEKWIAYSFGYYPSGHPF